MLGKSDQNLSEDTKDNGLGKKTVGLRRSATFSALSTSKTASATLAKVRTIRRTGLDLDGLLNQLEFFELPQQSEKYCSELESINNTEFNDVFDVYAAYATSPKVNAGGVYPYRKSQMQRSGSLPVSSHIPNSPDKSNDSFENQAANNFIANHRRLSTSSSHQTVISLADIERQYSASHHQYPQYGGAGSRLPHSHPQKTQKSRLSINVSNTFGGSSTPSISARTARNPTVVTPTSKLVESKPLNRSTRCKFLSSNGDSSSCISNSRVDDWVPKYPVSQKISVSPKHSPPRNLPDPKATDYIKPHLISAAAVAAVASKRVPSKIQSAVPLAPQPLQYLLPTEDEYAAVSFSMYSEDDNDDDDSGDEINAFVFEQLDNYPARVITGVRKPIATTASTAAPIRQKIESLETILTDTRKTSEQVILNLLQEIKNAKADAVHISEQLAQSRTATNLAHGELRKVAQERDVCLGLIDGCLKLVVGDAGSGNGDEAASGGIVGLVGMIVEKLGCIVVDINGRPLESAAHILATTNSSLHYEEFVMTADAAESRDAFQNHNISPSIGNIVPVSNSGELTKFKEELLISTSPSSRKSIDPAVVDANNLVELQKLHSGIHSKTLKLLLELKESCGNLYDAIKISVVPDIEFVLAENSRCATENLRMAELAMKALEKANDMEDDGTRSIIFESTKIENVRDHERGKPRENDTAFENIPKHATGSIPPVFATVRKGSVDLSSLSFRTPSSLSFSTNQGDQSLQIISDGSFGGSLSTVDNSTGQLQTKPTIMQRFANVVGVLRPSSLEFNKDEEKNQHGIKEGDFWKNTKPPSLGCQKLLEELMTESQYMVDNFGSKIADITTKSLPKIPNETLSTSRNSSTQTDSESARTEMEVLKLEKAGSDEQSSMRDYDSSDESDSLGGRRGRVLKNRTDFYTPIYTGMPRKSKSIAGDCYLPNSFGRKPKDSENFIPVVKGGGVPLKRASSVDANKSPLRNDDDSFSDIRAFSNTVNRFSHELELIFNQQRKDMDGAHVLGNVQWLKDFEKCRKKYRIDAENPTQRQNARLSEKSDSYRRTEGPFIDTRDNGAIEEHDEFNRPKSLSGKVNSDPRIYFASKNNFRATSDFGDSRENRLSKTSWWRNLSKGRSSLPPPLKRDVELNSSRRSLSKREIFKFGNLSNGSQKFENTVPPVPILSGQFKKGVVGSAAENQEATIELVTAIESPEPSQEKNSPATAVSDRVFGTVWDDNSPPIRHAFSDVGIIESEAVGLGGLMRKVIVTEDKRGGKWKFLKKGV
ncbi:hypothetical protein HK100_012580 [Physocladia obscura]|uniref:Uncharacterized protein n=1 Tax=Physocladia obscura TaxID=109957 RepID=A0AAD5T109_9FUNG|nr:hypothetical protein HK100_012580 [Physocladia obscura]